MVYLIKLRSLCKGLVLQRKRNNSNFPIFVVRFAHSKQRIIVIIRQITRLLYCVAVYVYGISSGRAFINIILNCAQRDHSAVLKLSLIHI